MLFPPHNAFLFGFLSCSMFLLNVKSQARNFLVQPNFRVSGTKIQFFI